MGDDREKKLDAHLAIVINKETGLYHGAIYVNHPPPSGGVRYLLNKTTKNGVISPRKAAEEINVFGRELGIDLLDPMKFEDIQPIPNVSLSVRTIFTLVMPREKYERPYVELWLGGELITGIDIHPKHLEYLVYRKIVELDSGNCDPELSAIYEHYVFVDQKAA